MSAPPTSEAATALMLHAAWQPLMMGRPRMRWTTTACPFMDTSIEPCTAPSTRPATHSPTNPGATPIPTSTSGITTIPIRISSRLPYRPTSPPTNCIATSAEAPKTVASTPSWASVRCWATLSEGSRTM